MVDILIFDRKQKELVCEKTYGSKATAFLYGTFVGGLVLAIAKRRLVSKIYAMFQKKGSSQKKIIKFAHEYGIKIDSPSAYGSFNDFITRKEQRQVDGAKNALLSPADSCLTATKINDGALIEVKGKKYTIAQLVKDQSLAKEYEAGYALIFRLAVYDYHRYCFPDSGTIIAQKTINGVLDSINHGATGKFSLCTNYRKVSLLETTNFGKVAFVEVGAMLVGRIVNTHEPKAFDKGDEKGYFEFGGSTIVMLLKSGAAAIDEDILHHSANNTETKVSYGERIGTKT